MAGVSISLQDDPVSSLSATCVSATSDCYAFSTQYGNGSMAWTWVC